MVLFRGRVDASLSESSGRAHSDPPRKNSQGSFGDRESVSFRWIITRATILMCVPTIAPIGALSNVALEMQEPIG